jgi:isopenicillin-N epimerase
VLPIKKLVRLLEVRGIDTLVDGAHAPGMLPLDLEDLGAAYYTGNLHKWVCAPKGAAFLHARADRQEEVLPTVISHGLNTPRDGFTRYQDLFDWPGTFDPTAWLSVPAAIDFMGALFAGGWPELRQRQRDLLLAARDHLVENLDAEAPCPDSLLGTMATLPLAGFNGSRESLKALQVRLFERHRIEVPLLEHGGSAWFRISAQVYNSADDYDALLGALRAEI